MSSDSSVVHTVSQHGVFFRHMLSSIGANARFCCNYFDVFLRHIDKINKQFVCRANQQRVIMPEFNKTNVIKELLNVKYNFASVSVLYLTDIVFCIESLCTELSFSFPLFDVLMYDSYNKLIVRSKSQLGWLNLHTYQYYRLQ